VLIGSHICRVAQQQMTLSDLEWLFPVAEPVVKELLTVMTNMMRCVSLSLEAERRQKIIAELIPLYETIESSNVRLSMLLSSCRHREYVHPSVSSSVDVMKRIMAKSASAVSRARHGDATVSDVAMLLELASQCRKIIDSAAVHIGMTPFYLSVKVKEESALCLKKSVQICFCQNFVKFPSILISFYRIF